MKITPKWNLRALIVIVTLMFFFSSWPLEISIIEWSPLLNVKDKIGEKPQQLRILATLLYDLSSAPSTAMVALSYL